MLILTGMFSKNHFMIMGVAIVLVFLAVFWIRRYRPALRSMLAFMGIFALLMELLKIFARSQGYYQETEFIGFYYPSEHLPFHLCSILVFVFWYLYLINKNEERQNMILAFMYPVCFFGGFFAILIPTSGADFADPAIYEYFIYHIGMVIFGLYVPLSKQVRLGKKQWLSGNENGYTHRPARRLSG